MKLHPGLKRWSRRTTLYELWSAYGLWRELRHWRASGGAMPPPRILKHRTVAKYAKRFGLKILVETGTCIGDMVHASRRVFERIYSIELDDSLYEAARARFQRMKHVTILRGDSSILLPQLVAGLHEPCLFWLDAHYSGGCTARGQLETPVECELKSVLSHGTFAHVVLIDDARLFTGQDDYPRLNEVLALVERMRPSWHMTVEDDIIRICPG